MRQFCKNFIINSTKRRKILNITTQVFKKRSTHHHHSLIISSGVVTGYCCIIQQTHYSHLVDSVYLVEVFPSVVYTPIVIHSFILLESQGSVNHHPELIIHLLSQIRNKKKINRCVFFLQSLFFYLCLLQTPI